jgi:aspartate carbamoyltransferase regulatory subunit
MISLSQILAEEIGVIYRGLIRVTYSEGTTVSEVSDIIRALEGVTIVTSVDTDEQRRTAVFKIKVRSTEMGEKAGILAFKKIRQNAIKHNEIQKVEIGTQSIERTG